MNDLSKIYPQSSIRLSPSQIQNIKSCIYEIFGEKLKIYLFGSRTNPHLRGGDIDLFVLLEDDCKTKLEKILIAKSKIEVKIGDQKIDLVVATNEDLKSDTFLREVYSKGIQL